MSLFIKFNITKDSFHKELEQLIQFYRKEQTAPYDEETDPGTIAVECMPFLPEAVIRKFQEPGMPEVAAKFDNWHQGEGESVWDLGYLLDKPVYFWEAQFTDFIIDESKASGELHFEAMAHPYGGVSAILELLRVHECSPFEFREGSYIYQISFNKELLPEFQEM